MTEPVFDEETELLYTKLPEIYRVNDEPLDWVMKKWMSGIGGQLNLVRSLYERFDFDTLDSGGTTGDSSDLTDPNSADDAWLEWLGQHVAAYRDRYVSNTALRAVIRSSVTGIRPGTKASIAKVAQTVLTGTQTVSVYDHSISAPGDGGQWDVMIVTISSETVSSPSAAVIAAGQKPAGIVLHDATSDSTWTELLAAFPTWAGWNTTWQAIAEAGL